MLRLPEDVVAVVVDAERPLDDRTRQLRVREPRIDGRRGGRRRIEGLEREGTVFRDQKQDDGAGPGDPRAGRTSAQQQSQSPRREHGEREMEEHDGA